MRVYGSAMFFLKLNFRDVNGQKSKCCQITIDKRNSKKIKCGQKLDQNVALIPNQMNETSKMVMKINEILQG